MGLGELSSPDLTFVRRFRWTLCAPNLPEYLVTRAAFYFHNHKIKVGFLEVVDGDLDCQIHNWLEHPRGPLDFTTYDGCGTALYQYRFFNPAVEYDRTSFNYESSDISIRKVRLRYTRHERITKPEIPPLVISHGTTIQAGDCQPLPVELFKRPTVSIEETEVNFLADKMWIPGKATWLPVEVRMSAQNFQKLMDSQWGIIELKHTRWDKDKEITETWQLLGASVEKVEPRGFDRIVTLAYRQALFLGSRNVENNSETAAR